MAGKRPGKTVSIGSTELAYQRIRQAIIDGSYAPGQRLIEQSISEEFDLSRTPIRESLRRLEAEGLVLIERNRGATSGRSAKLRSSTSTNSAHCWSRWQPSARRIAPARLTSPTSTRRSANSMLRWCLALV